MVEIRLPRVADASPCVFLAAELVGEARAPGVVRSHLERRHLLVADAGNEVVGLCAWRADWFQCTLVTLVVVREDHRRRGIARRLYEALEAVSPSPRLFSSAEETNAASIRMHTALGFTPSGHIDNLPQGSRELLFYKAIRPRLLGRDTGGPA